MQQLNKTAERLSLLLHAGICRDPVYFPRLASVIGECLLKAHRIRFDVTHDKSNKIVARKATERVPTVVYSLTDYGQSLPPLVENVRRWGRVHIDRYR